MRFDKIQDGGLAEFALSEVVFLLVLVCICGHAGLLSCYYQPRADDLLGTYYYRRLSTIDVQQEDVTADPEVSDGVQRRRRGVVSRRLLVLAAFGGVLAAGVLCRLLI